MEYSTAMHEARIRAPAANARLWRTSGTEVLQFLLGLCPIVSVPIFQRRFDVRAD